MSIYAMSKRPDALRHLVGDGFVKESEGIKRFKEWKKNHKEDFKDNKKESPKSFLKSLTSISQHLTEQDIRNIVDKLREATDGKALQYADAVVKYMSNDMAELGNKATMKVYGRNKFNEDYYFPIISDPNYIHFDAAKGVDKRISSVSFSKSTVDKAKNAVVLGSFTEIAVKHCEDMATYSTTLAPISDFTRIYNYKYKGDLTSSPVSIRSQIERVYGKKANRYIEQFLKDVNGGALQGTGADFVSSLVGNAKRDAVLASLQVTIQQPSAYLRATSEISWKYFTPHFISAFSPKEWNELKKYAPVARIKEIGGYDTNMGRTATEDVLGKYSQKDKPVLKRARDKFNELLGNFPAYMDRITWAAIWKAVKNETKSKNKGLKVNSEEFLNKAGERFTYVINQTQVYDSVFARSHWLRSTDSGIKQMLAFKNEQIVAYNMLYKAWSLPQENKRKKAKVVAKTVTAVLSSIVLNSLLKGLTGAERDDDEEKSFAEKYVSKVVNNVIMGIFSIVPFLDDFASLVQSGFESSEMTDEQFNRIVDVISVVTNEDKTTEEKLKSIASAVGLIAGIPLRNLWKEVEGIRNVYNDIVNREPTTSKGIYYAILEEIDFKKVSWFDIPNTAEQFVEAYFDGDQEHMDKTYANLLAKNENDEDDVASDIKSAVGKAYTDGKITESQALSFLTDYFGMDDDKAYWQVQKWKNKDDDEWSKYQDFVSAVDSGEPLDDIIDYHYEHGATKSNLSGALTSYYKDKYLEVYETDQSAVNEIERKMLNAYEELGYDYDENYIYWKFEEWKNTDNDDYSKYGEFYNAVETGVDLRKTINYYTSHGVTKKALASNITKQYKDQYISLYKTNPSKARELKRKLVEAYASLGYNRSEKSKDIDNWLK